MAYVIGLMTPEEEKDMEARGWELEDCPAELIPEGPTTGMRMRMVFVDSSMFDIMNGPDWEGPVEQSGPRCGHSACSQHYIDTGDTRCLED